ncbi:MAG TPA: AAA family ATPase, partial [Actinomycetota bacterium]|nr:AAA family ATPase [Actinomycetota bacterium]
MAGRARERGGVVLWGRCWEAGGAPAYWPWVQSLRSLVRTIGVETAIGHLGDDADELAQLLPEIRELRPVALESPTADPDAARFRLFDSLTRFLLGAASDRPLVVVLDDLHAADVPSLLLLRFQAAQMRDAALMLVGTYRDVAVDPGHPMAATVAELLREPHTRLFPLKGLSVPEVSALIEATTGTPPDEAVTATVHDETQGNPLFVAEVVRLLAAEGRLMDPSVGSTRVAVPEGVREVIGQRLERLSDACRNLLALASVLGREFTIEALGRVSELPSTELLALLEEAAEARLISDVPGTLGGLRFSHALVRDSLYEGISPPRRYELHQGVAVALERLYGAEDESHLAEIAHHWFAAAPAGHGRQAVEATRRAGDRAMELLAYEEAARLFEKALRALALAGAPDVRERVELLLALGDARGRAGDEPGEKRTMLEAVRVARDRGLPEHLARAALGYGGRLVWRRAAGDDRMVELVEEALSALSPGDSALRARLLARLSGALRDEPVADRRDALSGEAVRMARRLGDQEALAYALLARYTAIWSPDSTREQLEIAEELKRIAAEIGDRDRLLQAVLIRHKALMTLGELEEARAEHVASARLAEETRQPSQAWYVAADRATLALLEGRFDQAEDLVRDARRVGGSAQRMEAETAYRLQLFWLRRERGRAAEAERHIRDAVHEFPWYPMFRCALANLYAAMGRRDEARVVFEDLAVRKFDDLPFDNEWLFGMCLLPEVAALLEDRSAARRLYERLCPYADLAANSPPELWLGPVDRYLGILAGVEGLLDEAAEHLSAAVDRSLRMGAAPFVAHAQHELAAALLRRDAPGDGGRARELASGALERARDLGMGPLVRSTSALLA